MMLELLQGTITHDLGNDRSHYEDTEMGIIGMIHGHDWNHSNNLWAQLEQFLRRCFQ